MKVVKLSAENILRLNAVEITPDGNIVIIGGDNEQGKTSVLDSIFLALGGRLAKHKKPLKEGTEKGKTVVDLGDLVVTRTFTSNGGGTLKVSSKDGANYSSPQKMLDGLMGKFTFDPLQWVQMDSQKQVAMLKELVGLDFTKIDNDRKAFYDSRTDINREIKDVKGTLSTTTYYNDAPDKPVSYQELVEQLNIEEEKRDEKETIADNIASLKTEYKEIKDQIAALETRKKEIQEEGKSLQAQYDEMPDAAVDEIKSQMSKAEEVNQKVSSNQTHTKLSTRLKELETQSEKLTTEINAIDAQKVADLQNAKFPIDDLGFDDSGVVYKNIPFEQCSSAEKLRVSIAMAIAMNPKLKVLLIRDGSLLDNNNLKLIASMADKADCQVWIERVSKDENCHVVIEDGYVKKGDQN